jgi:hypothetical protein
MMSRPIRRFPHDCHLSSRDSPNIATLRNLRQQNFVVLEIDLFTASERRLRGLVVSFSGLR